MGKVKIRESDYTITENGVVQSPSGKTISFWTESNTGYQLFRIRVGNKSKCYRLHRILAECFIPNPDNSPFVKHKNDDRSNNILSNLEWGANADNVQEGYDNGCYKFTKRSYPIQTTHKVTGEILIFKSLRSLQDSLGCNRKSVTAILNGRKEGNYDYTFKYLI